MNGTLSVTRIGRIHREVDWIPAVIGALIVWIAIAIIAGHGMIGTLQQALTVASFLALVGLGQVFVIAVGSGNIDLSVPYTMTLSAYVTAKIMSGDDAGVAPAVLVALLIGGCVGLVNALVIRLLRIPPLVATMAVGLVVQTFAQLTAVSGAKQPSPAVVRFATGSIGGVTYLALFVILVAVVMYIVLGRSTYGRRVLATGQSVSAAKLSGIRTERVILVAYVLCGMTAAICGLLLCGYTHGPSLDMALPYQLGAIAVVVIGGTAINGGRANVLGVWAAALLLTMLSTLVSLTGAGSGVQKMIEGLVIVLVLALMPKRTSA